MIIQDDFHPFAKVGVCAWNIIGIKNKLIGFYLGKNRFTEKDHKMLRLTVFLMFELINEDLTYELSSIYKKIPIKEAYELIVCELSTHVINIAEATSLLDKTDSIRDDKHIILKITRELMRFFELINMMYDKYPLLTMGTCFREKISLILEETKKTIDAFRERCVDELKNCEVVVNTLEHSFKRCLDRRNTHEESKSSIVSFNLSD